MEFRKSGDPPFSLIDYFKKFHNNFLIFADESHQTLPQIKAMSIQDRIRKQTLIDHGFRLPSAIDNRPLTFEEFEKRIDKAVYVSATPSIYEKKKADKNIIQLLIRPTGLLEPKIELRSTNNQLKDLVEEINKRIKKNQKVLVLTITKKLAEAISEYLSEKKIKNKWLHSEVKTLERPEILKNLRLGVYDVLVGINLLREGLDLPEVSLVAILDADKEGFLRNETTLIQIMGRAARHQEGSIILYADKKTKSIKKAIKEINRRRKIQEDYNKNHNITPKAISKEIKEWNFLQKEKQVASEFMIIKDKKLLEKEMKKAAKNLDFERAAEIRDLIKKL
jgi:excinuclease ABC subunit B